MKTIPVMLFTALALTATEAAAWDFTCSPAETTVIGYQTPSVMFMLDRSGSMSDSDGEVANTCKVCEVDDTYYEVAAAGDCVGTGVPWTYTDSGFVEEDGAPLSGYSFSFSFAVPPATEQIDVEIVADADLNGTCEWADVYVDGDFVYKFDDGGNCSPRTRTFAIDSAYAADGQLDIEIITSGDNNDCDGTNTSCASSSTCDGVDTFCHGGNTFQVTVTHVVPTYHGSVAWEDPCGVSDKWEQAVGAIDAVVLQGQSTTPESVHFGLGLFSGSSASVERECVASNHANIMSTLESRSPSGSTPTARAIRTAFDSSCVAGESYESVEGEVWVTEDDDNTGYDMFVLLDEISPGQDVELILNAHGDFGGSCEFADVLVDGVAFGRISDSTDCRSGGFDRAYTVPASYVADGQLVVQLITRGDDEDSEYPTCGDGDDGVDARCNNNGVVVQARWLDPNRPASATILITDGEPTRDLNGSSTNAYIHPIEEACAHRVASPLFVVGLGAGTDEDYNNILAAAGGTGECVVNGATVDPCDDPDDWSDLRNDCTGSIQAGNEDALMTALSEITTALGCTFNINFLNSGFDAVPADATDQYEYMSVEVRTTAGATQRIAFAESASASPPSEGWRFPDDNRQYVVFTDHYCGQMQSYAYSEVTTHLACLCQEATGSTCDVPDHEALGLCPEGTWRCDEGTDWCEADAECCLAGEACRVPDQRGICAQGLIVCDTPAGTCTQVIAPTPEVCDGVDNDCDGVVDDVGGACVVEGEVGRCAVGTRTCTGGIEECESVFVPMPELCNGLDDDCDGVVDNISESWADNDWASFRGDQDARAAACRRNDVCVCPGGATDDHAGVGFASYVDEWDPVCQCGSSLGPANDSPPPPEPTRTEGQSAAGCNAVGTGTRAAPWVLLLIFALVRRRFLFVEQE